MTKLCLLALIFLCFTPGCCYLERGASALSQSSITIDSRNPQIEQVHINNQSGVIYVEGTVHKAYGEDLTKTKVVVLLLDGQGQVLKEVRETITPTRTHTNRGRTGRFNVKVPYDQNIKACKLSLE